LTNPEDLQTQLQKALAECASLREENERLKKLLGLPSEQIVPPHELIISGNWGRVPIYGPSNNGFEYGQDINERSSQI